MKITFWDVYHEYEAFNGKLNDWSIKTRKKYETIRFNLKSFQDWRRKNGLPSFEVTFDFFDEYGLQSFVDYLRDVKKYVNTTIKNYKAMKPYIDVADDIKAEAMKKFDDF